MNKYITGLGGGGKAYYILEQFSIQNRPFLVLVAENEYNSFVNNLTALSVMFEDVSIYQFPSGDRFTRINTLNSLRQMPLAITVTTPEGLKQKTFLPHSLKNKMFILVSGGDYPLEFLTEILVSLGYTRDEFVEERGQFSRRGEILDFWPCDSELPYRIVFYDNTIESIRKFDIATQRSLEFVERIMLIPATETTDVYLPEYLMKGTVVYLDAEPEVEILNIIEPFDKIINNSLAGEKDDCGFVGMARYNSKYNLFADELKKITEDGYKTQIMCANEGEKERIEEVLSDNKYRGQINTVIAHLEDGFCSSSRKLAVFSSQEILYKRRIISFPKFKTGRRLEALWEISSGDYVVHEKYGIGRYLGLKKLARGDHEAEYIQLEYKGGDKLYVPVEDFNVVQKYIGMEGFRPKLHSLDTVAWERIKKKAKENAEQFAKDLIKLYAERDMVKRAGYGEENPWEKELADSFAYTETEDQLKAINDIHSDLSGQKPMERLICGDVGYGKTEVAIRAAFKIVIASKQAAVLVPTTVLAEQHFNTFSERLSPFPVKVAMLSRFQSKKEQKEVVEKLKAGVIDIVIGTHRLLQKDIVFDDLGLLIIDEEHRFGVKQKEKIKALKKNVDVLMLSATPIPRTLSFALSNIRDLSIIETPPYGRLPIETFLGAHDDKIIKRVIEAELSRNGQVFYVHNRVETIESRCENLKSLVPDVRVGIMHGQMPALDIEKTMWKFLHKEIDVLVATTIIESGLDIPSVNTMIVEEAENFGLAQLYQLRGRIGRTDRKAYCYLFSSKGSLTEQSKKRLEVLSDLNELGSGFRLALRDLEIRGGGNVLGAQQHGFVKEIGFELYSRLIAEAGGKMKGVNVPSETQGPLTTVDFLIKAFIPENYVTNEEIRITFYRKMAAAKNEKELLQVNEEMLDRFGKLPEPLEKLFKAASIRLKAEKLKIRSIVEREDRFEVYFSKDLQLAPENIVKLAETYKDVIEFTHGDVYGVKLKKKGSSLSAFEYIENFLDELVGV